MYGNVPYTGHGREDQGKIRRLEEAEEGSKSLDSNNLNLIFLVGGKVAQSQCCLTLDLGGWRVHEVDQRLDEFGFGR
jgi:hypothetical protein